MDKHTFSRLMRLAQRTGTPVVVTDTDGQEPAVLLPLETYESMMDALSFDDEGIYDDEEALFPFDVPMQEIDQDAAFVGEEFDESVRDDEVVLEDVPFDPPIPEPVQTAKAPADEPGEEQFYLEPIE